MPQTIRQFWIGKMGRNVLNFNWDAIHHDSVVLISVSSTTLTTRQITTGSSVQQPSLSLISRPTGRLLIQITESLLSFRSIGERPSTS